MPPAILDAMTVFRAQLTAGENQARATMLARWRGVEAELQRQTEDTAQRLIDMQRNGVAIRAWRVQELDRYQSLVRQSRRQIVRYVDDVALPTTATRQAQLIQLGAQHASVAQNILGVRGQFGRLPTEVIENLTGVAGDGSPLRDLLLDSYGPTETEAILDRMIDGVARGQSARVIAADVVRNGYSQSLVRMMATMRTEPLRAYRQSSLSQYQRSGIVTGYRRLSARDSRVCMSCLIADGQFYPLNVPFEAHPQCRCAMTPELRTDAGPQWETGTQWFVRQDETTQRAMMGPGRFNAWQDGQFELGALVKRVEDATWGTSLTTTPLQELT